MTELLDLVAEALTLAVSIVVPLAAAGLAGGVVGGLLAGLIGLQDQSIATLVRAASVVIALILVGGLLGERVEAFTARSWGDLARWGSMETPARGGS